MLDFLSIGIEETRNGKKVKPKFEVNFNTKDLMTRGGDFYAVWDERKGIWSTNEQSVIDQVDAAVKDYASKRSAAFPEEKIIPAYMRDSDSGSIDRWHKYVKDQMRTTFHPLDEKLIFMNQEVRKEDYVTKVLPYALEEGDISAYEELVSTLYAPEERRKFEWAIGAIISGDSKWIQKFEVFYGDKGTGKSTIFNIILDLFDGFTSTLDAKALGNASKDFALESFKNNPLVSIQHDGNLSRIEDNTRLNTVISHEPIMMNTKYGKQYETRIHTFLFIGSNNPVKITDAKSGILRRLIDVNPTGMKLPRRKYDRLIRRIGFEKGAIAYHCLKVYEELGYSYYDDYVPRSMMSATNEFYDFVDYYFDEFSAKDQITQHDAWTLYNTYCEYAGAKRMTLQAFALELKNYFKEFKERTQIDGKSYRKLYSGFKRNMFEDVEQKEETVDDTDNWLTLLEQDSIFDEEFHDAPAQVVSKRGTPFTSWDKVMSTLADIDTSKEHFVKPRETNLICADFDMKDADGNKDLQRNIEAALSLGFPPTYAEVSRSGGGLHLYYFYSGDIDELKGIFDDYVEIRTLKGNSSFRRRLTLCNRLPIAVLSIGSLPRKEAKNVVDWKGYNDEKHLHNKIVQTIKANLNKERADNTTQSIHYIKEELDRAYESGLRYDVSELQPAVLKFAFSASNQADHCVKLVAQMHFKSDDEKEIPVTVPRTAAEDEDGRLVFFDVEVYKNFNCLVWKYEWSDTCTKIPFPTPSDIEALLKHKIIGFNNLNYDNPIICGMSRGMSPRQLYDLSQDIIVYGKSPFRESRDWSYTDVYDFSTEKMSLKKWEFKIEGQTHIEMSIPWDEEVPEELWETVMEYCANDVRTTEAVFHERKGDFMARKIQVELVKLLHGDDIHVTVNDTTNTLSKRIIFGNERHPQIEFNYRDLSKPVGSDQYEFYREHFGEDYKFRVFDASGLPVFRDYIPGETLPDGWSILPFFPGYTFDEFAKTDKSHYLGDVIGEGGRNYSVPGYHEWVWDGDISSQHPHSAIAECLFGPRYTKIFAEIVEARVAVKHKDFETAGKLLGGALKPYLNDESYKDLAQALKIIINSIYGLTSASFDNEFRDKRNKDNIVAKRGALFMTLLKQEVEKRGFTVCHIKTDSIKIPHATEPIKAFILSFGREFGYEFETEAIFSKFAIFNDSAYIGYDTVEGAWVTKADQFKKEKQPYLYKTLFSHEPYVFNDFCVVKSVQKGSLYLDLNEGLGEPVDDLIAAEKKKLERMVKKAQKELKEKYPGISDNWLNDLSGAFSNPSRPCEYPEIVEQEKKIEHLMDDAPTHHKYTFVGRVGMFTPVLPGAGGGALYRVDNGKYSAATGSTGYLWLESANVKQYGKEDYINKDFFRTLVDEAKADIGKYVDPEYFLSDVQPAKEPVADFMNIPDDAPEEIPFEES